MAEALFYMAEKLIGRLGSLALESWNVKSDIEKLKNTTLTIKAVLLDAEEQQDTNHQVKNWLDKLKDTFDDADILLDDVSTEALRQQVMTRGYKKAKKVRKFFSSFNPLLFSFKMAQRIKEIRKKLEAIDDDRKKFHFTNRTLKQRVEIKRETHSFIPEEDVVGREEEKKELIEFLMNSNMDIKDNVSIISIIGFGGLGKTALAQLVYNDKAVQGHFELKMWVCVSDDDFDVKAIAMKIIDAMKIIEPKTNDGMDRVQQELRTNDGMDRVQQELRKKIEGRRYLLVLDDIWNENRGLWLQLMTLLKNGGKGSKIIITTRSEKVAKITGTSLPFFFLKGLDDKQSWKLFTQLAFENRTEPENQNLTAIGKEIVRKCAGVPLAIRSIGSLMYSMESENDWLNFKDKDLVKIDEEGDKVFQLIKLSYDHLPFCMKKCFSFCSLFPKDYYFERRKLIQLWVALGFVQSSDDSICLEDVGNKYFMNLVHRSFFQDLQRDDVLAGDIWRCKMHDLVHDLAEFVAGNDCVMVNEKGKQIDERTRHLSFGFPLDSSWLAPSSFLKAIKLRTFLLPQQDYKKMDFDCNLIMSSFEQLHVLDLKHSRSRTLPTCIGMLKHLRYLDLSCNAQIEVLPGSITKLYNLQTLILDYCFELRELPRDLWKLTRLRHLELHGCFRLTCMPRGIGQLTNLQTLSLFVLHTSSEHSGGARELSGLNNLKGSLEIKGLECLRCNTTEVNDINLMKKSNIDELTLTWDTEHDGNDSEVAEDNIILEGLHPHDDIKSLTLTGFGGVMISSWVYSLTNLLAISINDCTRLQNLPPLHLLSHLKSLNLHNLPCLKWIDKDDSDDSSSTFFPSLKHLNLQELPNLRGWWRCSEEGMRGGRCHQLKSLDVLYIYDCPNLIFMPLHPSVSHVMLTNVREKILQQAINHSTTLKLEYLYMGSINDLKSLSGVQHLTALRQLCIRNCEELDPCNDQDGAYGMQWKQLQNLRELMLSYIPKMESLPDGLQHVTTLRKLQIEDCANLTNLPEWIASLGQSLQLLSISKCPKLTSLPEGMRRLTSLQALRIIQCPQLEERCRKEVGEDWPKISHVPVFMASWV